MIGTPAVIRDILDAHTLACEVEPFDEDGQEKELAEEGIFVSASLCRESGEVIVKAVNRNPEEKELKIALAEGLSAKGPVRIQELSGQPEAFNSVEDPNRVRVSERMQEETDSLKLPAHSFVVARISR